MKRWRIASQARADLDAIWEYIAERSSQETAGTFIERFRDLFISLAQSPSAGVAVPELDFDRIRKFPMGNYVVYYRPMKGGVIVVRVLHGKRIQLRAFRENPRKPPR